jgi:hypothetical protein
MEIKHGASQRILISVSQDRKYGDIQQIAEHKFGTSNHPMWNFLATCQSICGLLL